MTKAAAGASRRVVRDVGRALAGCVIWLLIGSALPRQARDGSSPYRVRAVPYAGTSTPESGQFASGA